MADLNKVFLIGRLTQDPELRYTPSGAAVTDLRLATSRNYTTKDGDRREETLYIDVVAWNRQAENCCQYLRKGSAVHVEGYLKMETWDDKSTGEKRSKVKVEAERVQFLDSRRSDGGSDSDEGPAMPARRSAPAGGSSAAPRGGSFGGAPAGPARRPAATAPADAADDDIPF